MYELLLVASSRLRLLNEEIARNLINTRRKTITLRGNIIIPLTVHTRTKLPTQPNIS